MQFQIDLSVTETECDVKILDKKTGLTAELKISPIDKIDDTITDVFDLVKNIVKGL